MSDAQRERALAAMPREPDELAGLPEGPHKDALRAIRAEYGALALRNRRLIRLMLKIVGGGFATLFVAFSLIAIVSYSLTQDQADTSKTALHAVEQVQLGRKLSLGVTCAVQSAIAQAGRETITASVQKKPPPAQEAAFERLGFPPFAARKKAAKDQANTYVQSISASIDAQVGRTGDGLIRQKGKLAGTIDCKRLAAVARVPSG